jgi:hypothetical protein
MVIFQLFCQRAIPRAPCRELFQRSLSTESMHVLQQFLCSGVFLDSPSITQKNYSMTNHESPQSDQPMGERWPTGHGRTSKGAPRTESKKPTKEVAWAPWKVRSDAILAWLVLVARRFIIHAHTRRPVHEHLQVASHLISRVLHLQAARRAMARRY